MRLALAWFTRSEREDGRELRCAATAVLLSTSRRRATPATRTSFGTALRLSGSARATSAAQRSSGGVAVE